MTITSQQLRSKFLEYFSNNSHTLVKSSPLIPIDDPTLLFVNAGMVQFKNIFTQKEKSSFSKAVSAQKCIRAGGKHNDLENVGQTTRHHTFFEMLGNFSFGDYFKEHAITLAYDFLTKELGLKKEKLTVSVFKGDKEVPFDQESYDIWKSKIGISEEKILKMGREDNFWQMGDTGPCGPCTEIYYDCSDTPTPFGPKDEGDCIEIWNLVFMQYDKLKDGTLKPLPAPCVDTGMGLERLTAVCNNYSSNYDSDLLWPLIQKLERISGKKYQNSDAPSDVSIRVIADHARATAFLIADGLAPGNEGRSYVLRRIMRRAIRHGHQLGLSQVFFSSICLGVVDNMGQIYPELNEAKALMEKLVNQEEMAFRKTLTNGMELFTSTVKGLAKGDSLSGATVFKLYETYGFPPDLTEDLALERGLTIDWKTFNQEKELHEKKSAGNLGIKIADDVFLKLKDQYGKTNFKDSETCLQGTILAIIANGQEVTQLNAGHKGFVVLNETCFYGESGGQVGDSGSFFDGHDSGVVLASVLDTKKVNGVHLHEVETQKTLKVGQTINGQIDVDKRQAIMRNHSATHLVHAALRKVLGPHVIQKGSLVDAHKLRFDFSHFSSVTNEELNNVEQLVNLWILANEPAQISVVSMDEAKKMGALALFGEKYEAKVRVLKMGSNSTELCGGTHCHRTGDVGSFLITSESSLASGVRRIEAITGLSCVEKFREQTQRLSEISAALGVGEELIIEKITSLQRENKEAQKAQQKNKEGDLRKTAEELIGHAQKIKGTYVIIKDLGDIQSPKDLMLISDYLKSKLENQVLLLAGKLEQEKCSLLLSVSKSLLAKVHAGKILSNIAKLVDGKGGGRPDMAQAGGKSPQNSHKALKEGEDLINKALES